MNRTIVEATIAGLLRNVAGPTTTAIGPTTRLDDLGLDSLARIDLAIAAEDEFGKPIPDDELERFTTVGDLIDFIANSEA